MSVRVGGTGTGQGNQYLASKPCLGKFARAGARKDTCSIDCRAAIRKVPLSFAAVVVGRQLPNMHPKDSSCTAESETGLSSGARTKDQASTVCAG
jgi:hypothetical protein